MDQNIFILKIIDDYDYTIYSKYYIKKNNNSDEKLKELAKICKNKDYITYQ